MNSQRHWLDKLVMVMIVLVWMGCKKSSEPEASKAPVHILIYSKTKAFRHECIEPGGTALQTYFQSKGVLTTMTEDSTVFHPDRLKAFDAVMFFQTTGNVLDSIQQVYFQQYIRSGKGYAGIHAAADTEYDWPWYGQLVGAYYSGHPDIQQGTLVKRDTSHPACKHLPDRWTRTDEWYNFKTAPANVNVLLSIDETTFQGGTMNNEHPMSWYHTYDGGRSFYTALGHTVESYRDTMFLEHILQGVKWAAGKNP